MMAESVYKESENVMSVQYDKEDTIILESSRRCDVVVATHIARTARLRKRVRG